MEKTLYRSRKNRMIWGVCGGLADYFDLEPTIVRLIFVLLAFANGMGVLIYIILAIVVPQEGAPSRPSRETIRENVEEMKGTAEAVGKELRSTFSRESGEAAAPRAKWNRNLVGVVFIVFGLLFLLGSLNLFRALAWTYIWPVLIIAVGLILIFANRRRA
ncbi:MAG: PspC domain-containing protein [Chloroflexota bacterium]